MASDGILQGKITVSPKLAELLALNNQAVKEIVANALNEAAYEGQELIRGDIRPHNRSGNLEESISVDEADASQDEVKARIYGDTTKAKYMFIFEFGGEKRNYPAHGVFRKNIGPIVNIARRKLTRDLEKMIRGR